MSIMNTIDEYGGESSDFSPLDLMGSLILNGVASTMAAKQPSFRIGVYKDKSGNVPAWADARLLGGVAAALAAQFFSQGNPSVRKYGHDAAIGLLNSYVATEQCRSAAESKMQDAGSSNMWHDDEDEGHLLGLDDDEINALLGV